MATHLLAVKYLNSLTWQNLIQDSLRFHKDTFNYSVTQKNKHAALLFLEPSTRTQMSFSMACHKLGLSTHYLNAGQSSLAKGESLKDTLLNLEAMGVNVAMVRLKEEKLLETIAKELTTMSLVCAGEGKISHPSQALLDACTIFEHFQKLDGLKILFLGDIEHSRVYSSNIEWMPWFNNQLFCVSPKTNGLLDIQTQKIITKDWSKELSEFDIIMMLRPQLERSADKEHFDPEKYHEIFGLTEERFRNIKSRAIFMHPGPFYPNVEFDEKLLSHKSFKIYRQVELGVFARMSLLNFVLDRRNE